MILLLFGSKITLHGQYGKIMSYRIYNGKKVLLTGHTGFKGSWLAIWLKSLGAEVFGYSLKPDTVPSMFSELMLEDVVSGIFADITDAETLNKYVSEIQPEFVFHLAAQPLVRVSYEKPVLTYHTNVMGTLNVLEAARSCSAVKAFVNVTTDKCYENKEISRGYKENEPMGGYDMYSSSKGCVEIMSSSYRRSFLQGGNHFALGCARAGNVIGGGDWAKDRLIPDCVTAINNNIPINIRKPNAVRPWQHVLEPLSGYLRLGEMLYTHGQKYAEGFNFGPERDSVQTVADMVNIVINTYGRGKMITGSESDLHEANLLMLNIEKACNVLGWKPKFSAKKAVEMSINWYREFYAGNNNMLEYTLGQIKEYEGA